MRDEENMLNYPLQSRLFCIPVICCSKWLIDVGCQWVPVFSQHPNVGEALPLECAEVSMRDEENMLNYTLQSRLFCIPVICCSKWLIDVGCQWVPVFSQHPNVGEALPLECA